MPNHGKDAVTRQNETAVRQIKTTAPTEPKALPPLHPVVAADHDDGQVEETLRLSRRSCPFVRVVVDQLALVAVVARSFWLALSWGEWAPQDSTSKELSSSWDAG